MNDRCERAIDAVQGGWPPNPSLDPPKNGDRRTGDAAPKARVGRYARY